VRKIDRGIPRVENGEEEAKKTEAS